MQYIKIGVNTIVIGKEKERLDHIEIINIYKMNSSVKDELLVNDKNMKKR